MGWVDDLADTAGVVASLAECLTEHGSRSLAGAGESYKDVMSRWWAEEIEAARRTRELEAGASLPPPARMSLRPGDGALIV
jgi:hypothetical protein